MISKQTLEEAQAVPNVVLVDIQGAAFNAYVKGDVMPAWWVAAQVPPTQSELLTQFRSAADALFSTQEGMLFRSVLLVALDEMNLHALKINAILSAVDGAATFAALKTSIAAIADYPQRTPLQLRNAVVAKNDSGAVDT